MRDLSHHKSKVMELYFAAATFVDFSGFNPV